MDKLIKHLDFLQESSDKMCQYLSEKKINTIQFFCLGLLRRIDDTTTATKILFGLLSKNYKYEFSIGIMFRTLLLDTLIGMNLKKLINDSEAQGTDADIEQSVNEFCNVWLSDGLRVTLNYIQDAETYGMRTAEETAHTFKSLGHTFKPFFDNYPNDGTRPALKFKNAPNAKEVFKNLAKTDYLKEAAKIYDSYVYLSKYDHFGSIYYHAINETLENKIKIYANAAETFVAHNALIHVVLARHSQNNNFINKQSRIANDYLLNNVINQKNS